MEPRRVRDPGDSRDAESKGDQQNCRGQCERDPGQCASDGTCASEADDDADLAARRTGKELAQSDDLRKRLLVEPTAALNKFRVEITDMCDRAPEMRLPRGEGTPQKLRRARRLERCREDSALPLSR